jgi:transcriptional regulator with XRE-family HTH domain
LTTPCADAALSAATEHGSQTIMAKKSPDALDIYVGSRARMRRMMLGMTQERLAHKLGLTFQQVQKYEKGMNRMGSSRLQQIADILQVPVTFFFEGVPGHAKVKGDAPSPAYVSKFLATPDGLALTKAFMQIKNKKVRRSIVEVVNEIAGPEG